MANSRSVAQRIANVYGRSATVLSPPIACNDFIQSRERGEFFLVVSRLVPYKRIDIAVEACNRAGVPLVVVGGGRDQARLAGLATRMSCGCWAIGRRTRCVTCSRRAAR